MRLLKENLKACMRVFLNTSRQYISRLESLNQKKKMTSKFIESMTNEFMDHTLRMDKSDGDRDKEAQFYVLRNTSCPAILIENFFMTNMRECRLLLEEEFQDRIVNCHMKSIKQIEQ